MPCGYATPHPTLAPEPVSSAPAAPPSAHVELFSTFTLVTSSPPCKGGGAASDGTVPARTPEQAAKTPFYGVWGAYDRDTDPWAPPEVRQGLQGGGKRGMGPSGGQARHHCYSHRSGTRERDSVVAAMLQAVAVIGPALTPAHCRRCAPSFAPSSNARSAGWTRAGAPPTPCLTASCGACECRSARTC